MRPEEFAHFENLLLDLAVDVTLYNQIFAPENAVETLNRFNRLVFGRLQLALIDRLFLGIARFMDPAATGRRSDRANLSFPFVIGEYNLSQDQEVSDAFAVLKHTYETTNIGQYRNKSLSHHDVATKLGRAKAESSVTPNQVQEILTDMMNLASLIKFKSGQDEHRVGLSSKVTLPRELDGFAFIAKLRGGT